jgi:prepilin-type N-terminal cleavage/methylation domain-containing protein
MKNKQQGFTLVEIAIVLVIIGLLLGGILKGQEMIIQAKIKNAITDFSGVSAAYFGYQDRYRATPGDDLQATRWSGAVAGDGNRLLTGLYAPAAVTDETALWWDHLRRSGFVSGSGTTTPSNAFNGILGVQTGDGSGAAGTPITAPAATLTGGTTGFTALIMCSTNLPDKVAIALDVQMDDGLVTQGFVRGVRGAGNATVNAAAGNAAASYVEDGVSFYTLCRQF